MDYFDRIQKSIDFIEENLKREVTLDEIAESAFFSKYYYSRLFMSMTGKSPMEYLRERRLAKAAEEMDKTDLSVLEVSLNYMFDSQEGFTRAFIKYFGISPGRYRRVMAKINLSEKVSVLGLKDIKREMKITPKVIYKEGFKLVGRKFKTTHKDNIEKGTIAAFYDEFKKEIYKIDGRKSEDIKVGICEGSTCCDDLWHTAGVIVEEGFSIPEGMELYEIPPSKYVVFSYKGLYTGIPEAYRYIYRDWMPFSGYELSKKGKDLQFYDNNRYSGETRDGEMDIYVPIE